jgi:hypothetical protein
MWNLRASKWTLKYNGAAESECVIQSSTKLRNDTLNKDLHTKAAH